MAYYIDTLTKTGIDTLDKIINTQSSPSSSISSSRKSSSSISSSGNSSSQNSSLLASNDIVVIAQDAISSKEKFEAFLDSQTINSIIWFILYLFNLSTIGLHTDNKFVCIFRTTLIVFFYIQQNRTSNINTEIIRQLYEHEENEQQNGGGIGGNNTLRDIKIIFKNNNTILKLTKNHFKLFSIIFIVIIKIAYEKELSKKKYKSSNNKLVEKGGSKKNVIKNKIKVSKKRGLN